MLKNIKIHNYALIQNLDIDFNDGFSTVTGETGAGKSILLGALSLAMGSRADNVSMIKDKKCIIEVTFDFSSFDVKEVFNEIDVDYEELTIIRREIGVNGKSRAFINDTPVTLANLKQLSSLLIDIHSQHENLLLSDNNFQMSVIDSIAKNEQLLSDYSVTYKNYLSQQKHLNNLKENSVKANEDNEYNQFQFNQLNELNLENINQEELEQELEQLNHSEDIQLNLSEAFNLLINSEVNIIDQLKQVNRNFDKIKQYFTQADDFYQRIESSLIDLQDIASDTEIQAEQIEYNPNRAMELKDKLDKLYSLFQKHNVNSLSELIEIKTEFEQKLLQTQSYEYQIEQAEKELKQTTEKLEGLAQKLNENRQKALPTLDDSITILLNELGMEHAKFGAKVQLSDKFLANGKNTIEFLFTANKNHPMQDIVKIASGGEISRLMLSIKYILSQKTKLPTIIFDEIDTGVSGKIADKMANIMQEMANNMQVISITHLPQIAAKGKTHYYVFKHEVNETIETKIQELNNEERIEELAKMLSGVDITNEAIKNAKALLQ